MPANNNEIEKRLWSAADELRANSKLKSAEYSVPVLGLIFLRHADVKFAQAEKELLAEKQNTSHRRRQISKIDYQARGVMYLPDEARWSNLIQLPESVNIGKAINDAMLAIEAENDDLKDVLPNTYNHLDNRFLSKVDFEKLNWRFKTGRKRIEAEKLRGRLNSKLKKMVRLNRTRTDYYQKFRDRIDEYNTGAKNVDAFYAELISLAQDLTEEEQRGIAENLSEEELALFDLLTKPDLQFSRKEQEEVKFVARDLLDTLKAERLVLDWRKNQQTRAGVQLVIEQILDKLPEQYDAVLYRLKCRIVYQHVYDSYYGDNKSIYSIIG